MKIGTRSSPKSAGESLHILIKNQINADPKQRTLATRECGKRFTIFSAKLGKTNRLPPNINKVATESAIARVKLIKMA